MTEANPYPKVVQLRHYRSKRYRRKVASRKQWAAILAEKVEGRACRIFKDEPATDAHHLIPRDYNGDDVAENIVGLSRDAHEGVTLREARHCRIMLTRLSDAEYAYATEKLGEGWAERVYGVEYERP